MTSGCEAEGETMVKSAETERDEALAKLAEVRKQHEEAALGWAETQVQLNHARDRIVELEAEVSTLRADLWHEAGRRED